MHLARLLRLDEITSVAIPTVEQETARDLVRAREDCRGDMMRARHRLSKLLLRHGIVYYGGTAWTGKHDVWLRRQRFEHPATQLTFESAFALAVEIGDWHRFTGRTIGSFVGLIPSEYSSGSSRTQGPITKTGNGHARRLLVEAAWHHRPRYQPGKTIRGRWDLASPAARARGDLGNRRLHDRWVTYIDRKKKATVANTAIARELAGWCWSLALLEE
jgi:transposase